MKRMKTFLIYALLLIGFWLFSNLLINVGINSTYKPIERLDDLNQIEVYQAEATLINGRIKGLIKNNAQNDISNKYIKLELFSERNVEIGTRYIEIGELEQNSTKPLEIYFKINHVKYYKLDIVDEKGPEESLDIKLLPGDLTTGELFWGVLIVLMIMG